MGIVHDRRSFLKKSGRAGLSALALGGTLGAYARHLSVPPVARRIAGEPEILRPPGALPEQAFAATCIRCQSCYDACPSLAIRLAGPGDPAPRDTPFVVPAEHACTLCLRCTQVCPTGALQDVAERDDVRMGVAIVDEQRCVSHNGSGVCGACHTACPLRNVAITQGLHNRPLIHDDQCVGCGLCEEACIVKGSKAIRVFSGRGQA
jgi:ferredoxin-type protein NapG